jgi:hypothetical protein
VIKGRVTRRAICQSDRLVAPLLSIRGPHCSKDVVTRTGILALGVEVARLVRWSVVERQTLSIACTSHSAINVAPDVERRQNLIGQLRSRHSGVVGVLLV